MYAAAKIQGPKMLSMLGEGLFVFKAEKALPLAKTMKTLRGVETPSPGLQEAAWGVGGF